jgi:hypothetical protein
MPRDTLPLTQGAHFEPAPSGHHAACQAPFCCSARLACSLSSASAPRAQSDDGFWRAAELVVMSLMAMLRRIFLTIFATILVN